MEAAKLKEDVRQAGRALQEGIERIQEQVGPGVRRSTDEAFNILTSLSQEVASIVRESPLLALAGAFAVGYFAARMARAVK